MILVLISRKRLDIKCENRVIAPPTPSAVAQPPPAVTPTVTMVTADDVPKKAQVLITDNTLPPAADGQHGPSQVNTTFATRTTPCVIFADIHDTQTLASDAQRPLEVHG